MVVSPITKAKILRNIFPLFRGLERVQNVSNGTVHVVDMKLLCTNHKFKKKSF